MKTVTVLPLLCLCTFSSSLFAQLDTAFVRFSGDTVNIWNVNITMHCAAQFVSEVTVANDTVFITEHDTSSAAATCRCLFDFSASLVGLEPGAYTAMLYRKTQAYHDPPRDTVFFVHAIPFRVSALPQPFATDFAVKACHSSLTPVWTQAVYPLHPGDFWQYTEDLYWRQQQTVMQDSARIGNHSYAVVQGIFSPMYQRQEGDRVYSVSTFDSVEYLLYDFSRLQGDTVATWIGTFDSTDMILTYTGTTTAFGTPLRVWSFLRDTRGSIDDELVVTIVDSLGPTHYFPYMGPRLDFQGAWIDGKVFGVIVSVPEREGLMAGYRLEQNYPNPFNPSTAIRYQLPAAGMVRLVVYDLLGREVAVLVHERQEPGTHEVTFDAANLPSGVYAYRLESAGAWLARRMMVLK